MTAPNSADFALLEIQENGIFRSICGIEGVSINRSTQTGEQYRRDCAKPNRPAQRRVRVNGNSFSVSGTGIDNVDEESLLGPILGRKLNWRVPLYKDNGTDTGQLLGTYIFRGILAARNQSWTQDAEATVELTIEGENSLIWIPGVIPLTALTFSNGDPLTFSDGQFLEFSA